MQITYTEEQKSNFFISKKEHAMGVVFMHIGAIKNLPALRNRLSKTNYEMDPFIVISFGRRVFKTSWRKHTLNPEFNEYAAFEVFPMKRILLSVSKLLIKTHFHSMMTLQNANWLGLICCNSNNMKTNGYLMRYHWISLLSQHMLLSNRYYIRASNMFHIRS